MLNFWPYYIRDMWTKHLSGCRQVALFGAGEHSRWLLDVVASADGPEVVALIDDNADRMPEIRGRPVVTPAGAGELQFDAIVISSDAAEERLFLRARQCFPDSRIVRLYEGLPPGPYDKQGEIPAGIDSVVSPAEAVNLETVVALAQDVETKERLIDVMGSLDPDPFIGRTIDGYRRAIERFGRRWRYIDLWSILYAYTSLTKPRRYLEIGTRRGHSLAAVCSASLADGNCDLEVVCCDRWIENYAGTANPGPDFVAEQMSRLGYTKCIRFLSGSSHELIPEFLGESCGDFDLITVDGDHSRDGAAADLANVVGRLCIGGMLAFDDINHPQHTYLHEVWKQATAHRPNLETYANPRNGTGIAAAIRYR